MHTYIKIKLLTLLLLATLLPVASGASVDTMTMVGTGDVHYLGFIKVYDAHLYALDDKDAARILDPEVSKCLKLTYDVKLKPKDFIAGANTVLERQHTSDYLDQLQPYIDSLHNAYQAVDKGDTYLLCYNSVTGQTTLSLNDKELAVVESELFSSAYFGIWLSPDQPLSPELQKKLVQSASTPPGGESP